MVSYYSTTCFPTFGTYKNIFPYIKLTRSHNTIHLAHRRRSSIEKYSRWPCHQVLRYNALEDQISMAQARLLLTIPNWVLGIAIQPALLKETWATKLFQNPIEKKKKKVPTEAMLCYVKAVVLTMAAAAAVVAAGSVPDLAHRGRSVSSPFSCHMRAQQQLPCSLLMHSSFFSIFLEDQ